MSKPAALLGAHRDLVLKLKSLQYNSKGGWAACCPAHDDRRPSLSVDYGENGQLLLFCHAGCTIESIVSALGMTLADLAPYQPPARRNNGHQRRSGQKKSNSKALGKIVATYDYKKEDGAVEFQVVRYDPKDFRQRAPAGDGSWTNRVKGCRVLPYRLPELLAADPEATVFIVEGEKDVDRLRALGLVATCNAGGAGKWRPEHSQFLQGRPVAILPDADPAGEQHSQCVASSLDGVATSVKIVELPGLPAKGDVSDWLEQRSGAADSGELRRQLEDLVAAAEVCAPGRVRIEITFHAKDVMMAALAAIAKDQAIFAHGTSLVSITERAPRAGDPHGTREAILFRLDRHSLFVHLSANARFFARTVEGLIERCPPQWCVAALDSWGNYRNRPLEGVTRCPYLTKSGRVSGAFGYDDETGIFLMQDNLLDVPDSATLVDAQQAAALMIELFEDFPFEADHNRSAVLAAVLTEPAKQLFEGPIPAFAIDANIRGSGKTLIAATIHAIHTGQRLAVQTASNDDDEWQKVITSLAIEGATAIVMDNADRAIGNRHLDAALTSTRWKGRLLGSSKTVDMPFRPIWYFTGNNLQYTGDLMRRVVPIRLRSSEEHPEERTEFRHPDLVAYALANRSKLLTAALTILRAYFLAGKPKSQLVPFGSFTGWSDEVRQAVVWLGYADPCVGSRQAAAQADPVREALASVLRSWSEVDPADIGKTAAEIMTAIEFDSELQNDFAVLCRCQPRDLNGNRIGQALKRVRGRVVEGYAIELEGHLRGRTVWKRARS